jgi:hypothetical protein
MPTGLANNSGIASVSTMLVYWVLRCGLIFSAIFMAQVYHTRLPSSHFSFHALQLEQRKKA